ncbi:MAG: DUF4175 family protein [Bacteroidota bacterium]
MGHYESLLSKLDAFIRKYYKNQLIRGAAITFTALTAGWLVFSGVEYFGHFDSLVRTSLFWTFMAAASFSLWKLVLIPVSKLFKLGKTISHEQAAQIIGKHFPNVSDKLLNTLQLKAQADDNSKFSALLIASIEQRTADLQPVPFTQAVDFSRNKRYFRFALIPFTATVVILFAAPSLLVDGSKRLVNHNTHFETPAPFQFIIKNDSLETVEGQDFTLDVETDGKVLPGEMFIEADGKQYRLDGNGKSGFSHVFKNPKKSTEFRLLADGYSSKGYELSVLPNPTILDFSISLDYPAYTGKADERLSNSGDLTLPAGTRVSWEFRSRNTERMQISFADTSIDMKSDGSVFKHSKAFMRPDRYAVLPSNRLMVAQEPMSYSVNVVPDLNPTIRIEEQQDSSSGTLVYFKGDIRDDYGFTKLVFHYRFLKSADESPRDKKEGQQSLQVNRSAQQDVFFHAWDMQPLSIMPGEELEYYFEVWDNDGVNGPKSARTQPSIYKAPSAEELEKEAEQNSDKLKSDLEKSINQTRDLQKDLNKAARDMVEKKNLNFDDRKKIEDLLKRQKELQKQVEDIRKQNEKNNSRENEFKKDNEQLREKKQQLEELFDKLMSDEMKKLLQELEKLMSELDKDQLKEKLEQMKLDSKDLEKQLDRTLELFKQLEVEKKIQENIEKLEQLEKEQRNLAEKTEQSKGADPQLKEQQQELNKKFDDLKKESKELQEKNKELEFPNEMSDNSQEMDDIDKDMEQSEQELGGDKKDQKKASQSQKQAADKMDKLAQKMKQQQDQQQQEQSEEDMKSLRMLLENLIRFSLDQESLMQELKGIDVNNPRYTKLAQRQRELKDDAKVLEDSLFALSKRVVQIQNIVNTEIAAINYNLGKTILNLQDRFVPQARADQQYVMTSVNNIALILTEAFNQMQQQMQSQQQMQGSCKKPGKGKPSPSAQKLRQMQQQLNEQMKALQKKMDGKKEGQKGKPGEQGSMSEELARMAAQQEAIRNELQQLSNQENKDGNGSLGNLDQLAKEMEQTEKDLVNRRINQETIKRQEDILTRLLESEKAEREREQDEKRRSTEGRDMPNRNTSQFEEYKRLKMKEIELLKTIPPDLSPFYKNLVNYYFQTLENQP